MVPGINMYKLCPQMAAINFPQMDEFSQVQTSPNIPGRPRSQRAVAGPGAWLSGPATSSGPAVVALEMGGPIAGWFMSWKITPKNMMRSRGIYP